MKLDNNLDNYFNELDNTREILMSIRQRKQIFELSQKQKANISDLLDLKSKFLEIKKLVTKAFEDQKLSMEELNNIIDQFSVTYKIITIILEEEDSYRKSVITIDKFYTLLTSTIHSWKYTVDIEKQFLTERYNSITKDGWVVNDDKFFELLEFLKANFEIVDYDPNRIQNDFDQIIFNLILILSFIGNDLAFNVAYVEQPFLIKTYFKYLNDFYNIGHTIKNLQENTFYKDSITGIMNNLETLKSKASESKDGLISIKSWGVTRGELEELLSLFREF